MTTHAPISVLYRLLLLLHRNVAENDFLAQVCFCFSVDVTIDKHNAGFQEANERSHSAQSLRWENGTGPLMLFSPIFLSDVIFLVWAEQVKAGGTNQQQCGQARTG